MLAEASRDAIGKSGRGDFRERERGNRSEVAQSMAWERGYYYRVRRENGRVVREYVGSGIAAAVIAEMDERERQEREEARQTERAERAYEQALAEQLDRLCELADLAARAALLAAGFRRHNRGEWRRRRGQAEGTAEGD
jgi:hypothetical protein